MLLVALDSVGIDPLGHGRAESVYAGSAFLFSRGHPKSRVPTWVFGPGARALAERLDAPARIFELLAARAP